MDPGSQDPPFLRLWWTGGRLCQLVMGGNLPHRSHGLFAICIIITVAIIIIIIIILIIIIIITVAIIIIINIYVIDARNSVYYLFLADTFLLYAS